MHALQGGHLLYSQSTLGDAHRLSQARGVVVRAGAEDGEMERGFYGRSVEWFSSTATASKRGLDLIAARGPSFDCCSRRLAVASFEWVPLLSVKRLGHVRWWA